MFGFKTHAANPLPAQDVFQLHVTKTGPDALVVKWAIHPGYFLYKDRIKIEEAKDSITHLGTISFPESVIKKDKQGQYYHVYRDKLSLAVPILAEASGESMLTVHYQGCSDEGFCYPPETKEIRVTVDAQLMMQSATLEQGTISPVPMQEVVSETPIFKKDNLILTLITFLGLGLLLAFTPCVLPMVPVLSGIIVGHSATITTRKAFFLSFSYVFSMSLTYALIGMLVAGIGANVQVMMQVPWVITLFSALFILLALSMFGFFELKLPVSFQARLAQVTRTQANGHYLGAAIMGALSTLILSPCVTAPLIGALSFIAETGKVLTGGLALFFLGLGMGMPLLLIGTSAGKLLPKAGPWMNAVKAFFGVVLLAVAIYLLSRLLPDVVIMHLWAILLIFSGIFMGAFQSAQSKSEKFYQASGLILFLYGSLILIGATLGSADPLKPLAVLKEQQADTQAFPTVKSVQEIQALIAQKDKRPLILDFYADWCVSCKILEKTTFQDPEVQAFLKNMRLYRVDITQNDEKAKVVMRQFNIVAPPTLIFFNTKGQVLTEATLVGEFSAKTLLQRLKDVELKDSAFVK